MDVYVRMLYMSFVSRVRQLRLIYICVHMDVYVRMLYMSFVSRVRQLRLIYICVHMDVYVRMLYMSFVSRVTVGQPRVIYMCTYYGCVCMYMYVYG